MAGHRRPLIPLISPQPDFAPGKSMSFAGGMSAAVAPAPARMAGSKAAAAAVWDCFPAFSPLAPLRPPPPPPPPRRTELWRTNYGGRSEIARPAPMLRVCATSTCAVYLGAAPIRRREWLVAQDEGQTIRDGRSSVGRSLLRPALFQGSRRLSSQCFPLPSQCFSPKCSEDHPPQTTRAHC